MNLLIVKIITIFFILTYFYSDASAQNLSHSKWETQKNSALTTTQIEKNGKIINILLVITFEPKMSCPVTPQISLAMLNKKNYGQFIENQISSYPMKIKIDANKTYSAPSIIMKYDNGLEVGTVIDETTINQIGEGKRIKVDILNEFSFIFLLKNSNQAIKDAYSNCLSISN